MPPIRKFTREQFVEAALSLVREKGMEAFTAKEIAERMDISTRPIFTAFKDMGELRQETVRAALAYFEAYIEDAHRYTPAFKQEGMQVIRFAQQEPRLFQLLFMAREEAPKDFNTLFYRDSGAGKGVLKLIARNYQLSPEQAEALFKQVWVYTYGTSVMCATHRCEFTDEELIQMLGVQFNAMLAYVRSEAFGEETANPEPL